MGTGSLPENRHYELALSVVVRRIHLFELIEHQVNFGLLAPSERIFAISSLKLANIGWIIFSKWPGSIGASP